MESFRVPLQRVPIPVHIFSDVTSVTGFLSQTPFVEQKHILPIFHAQSADLHKEPGRGRAAVARIADASGDNRRRRERRKWKLVEGGERAGDGATRSCAVSH